MWVPIVFNGHVFTQVDYDAYARQRDYILQRPRGHAALLYGGHIWHLAVITLPVEKALTGPTGIHQNEDVMFRAEDCYTGEEYFDDDLTNDEIALVIGTYYSYSDSKTLDTHLSWFPTPFHYDSSPEDYGCWTPYREFGYQNTNCGMTIPKTSRVWRGQLRGMSVMRKLHQKLENQALVFLQNMCSDLWQAQPNM
ncbi:hypothetical protein BDQ17DRAFT_1241513 [Cyathus striatus]|nr:hypothetical protein BDQ17DRAFT_1241513 [Cyathus striatus]